jgi:hypothetical protein
MFPRPESFRAARASTKSKGLFTFSLLGNPGFERERGRKSQTVAAIQDTIIAPGM